MKLSYPGNQGHERFGGQDRRDGAGDDGWLIARRHVQVNATRPQHDISNTVNMRP